MKIVDNNKEYTPDGYRVPVIGDYFVDKYGDVVKCPMTFIVQRLVVKPVPVEHTFAGIVFVETGEWRRVNGGEWFLTRKGLSSGLGAHPVYRERKGLTLVSYTILKPVRIA